MKSIRIFGGFIQVLRRGRRFLQASRFYRLIHFHAGRGTDKDTKELYSINSNQYTSKRRKLHLKIANKLMKKSSSQSGQQPTAILLGGGSASGKTTVRETVILKELAARRIQATTIDPDEIKEWIPEYESLKKTNPKHAARLVHRESCDIAAMLLTRLIAKRMHLIYEGTMTKTDRYKKLVRKLKQSGYAVHVIVVDVPLDLAKRRADQRAKITGRKIPHHVIETTHRLVPKTLECIKHQADSYRVYDNQHELTLIASNHYVEPDLYAKFLQKAGIKYRIAPTNLQPNMVSCPLPGRAVAIAKWIPHDRQKGTPPVHINDCDHDDVLDRVYPE